MRKRLSEKLWENSAKKVTYMALQIYRNKESNASLNYLSIKLVHTYDILGLVCTMYNYYPFCPFL